MTRIRILICALLASLALQASVLGTGQALASHSQTVFFDGGQLLLEETTRHRTIEKLKALGVRALRVELFWADVAPRPYSTSTPKFEQSNPASYDWGPYKSLLEEAKALNWPVLLTVGGPAPRWAQRSKTAPYVLEPNAHDYKEFLSAVGAEFGSDVSLYGLWNEPNDPTFLQPQFNSKGEAASPAIYRSLWENGYAGLQAAGLAHPKVLMGETEPVGAARIANPRSEGLLHDVAPVAFLRDTLCLNAQYKKTSNCGSLPAYGFSDHAYSDAQGPSWEPPAESVTIGVLGRLVDALNRAGGAGAIKQGMDIYITEFGVQSKPNKYFGVSPAKQVEYDAISEKIAYENPRVAAFSQYLLRDDPSGCPPGGITHGCAVGFQTGLEYVNAKHKPLYAAWPVPLVVTRTSSGYSLWGDIRPSTKATKATILIERAGSKSFTTLQTVTTNGAGYWTLNSSVAGTAWKVRWESPTGTVYEGPPIAASSG